MFEVARHIRGWTKIDLSRRCKLSVKIISEIENGDREPTLEEVEAIAAKHACHFPLTFFKQWWETKLDLSGHFAKNVPIDYYKYKVFRNANPPRLSIV